jgi:hypothetical protein
MASKSRILLTNLAVLILSIITSEIVFGFLLQTKELYVYPVETEEIEPDLINQRVAGVSTMHITGNDNGSFVESYTTITRDAYGRRVSQLADESRIHQKHLIFMGCSFTFGYGLDDEQTLPFLVNTQLSRTKPNIYSTYNYAEGGYSTASMLDIIEHRDLNQEVQEQSGEMIYVYINDHIRRNIGDMGSMQGGWANNLPYYFLENRVLKSGGLLGDRVLTNLIYQTIASTNTAKYFDTNLPVPSAEHVDLTIALIKQSKQIYESKFNGDFYVLIHPLSTGGYYTNLLIEGLNASGINVIEPMPLKADQKYTLFENFHPNSQLNQELAEYLLTKLPQ